ncbi:hypothetical protein [Oceaniglobus roseus]|uniref:hypothetical protein n=1 Tax=Oceaniglobus roseus TaxID=1737570 RepID=UPI000C7E9110|nr:hypothetical protein [Kandeliimicrobium roseum]
MTGFLRPEARAALHRWRDAIVGGVLLVPGLGWLTGGTGLLRPIGAALALLGAGMLIQGIRRARFPAGGGGAGMVEVTERQITYFGPESGGAVSIDSLARIEVRRHGRRKGPAGMDWILHADGAPPLTIPGDAENASALFDALAPLPGVDYARAIEAGNSRAHGLFVIWQKPRLRLH